MKALLKGILRKIPILGRYVNSIRPGAIKLQQFKKIVRGSGNKITIHNSSTLVNCTFEIQGNDNEILLDKNTKLNNVKFYIDGNHNVITMSSSVKFKQGGNIYIEDENCQIKVGTGTTFENVHLAATESNSTIRIGKDCMFAYDIDVRTGDSHSILDITSNKRINYAKDVSIGNHVWVASHVSILKGAIISNNSIVATRAVVTKAFEEENVILGGIPAKIMKRKIDWSRERL